MNIKDLKPTDYKIVQPKLNINNLSPEVVRVLGVSSQQSDPVVQNENTGIFGPAKDAIEGLKTMYGGGEQGIAQKLASDVQAGAQDMAQGNFVKGALKSGGRVAGDIAGAIFAPVGAALQSTGINKVFDKVGTTIADSSLVNKITDIPAVQKFASERPNAGEDFGRVLNLAMSGGGGKITKQGLVDAVKSPVPLAKNVAQGVQNLRPTAELVQQARQTKLNEGFAEQNIRLKSAGKSFNENTKTYTDPATKQKVTVTPIDTFAEHNIAPVIEKGTIKMGDWKTGEGQLGKIKNAVDTIDNQVDTILTDSQKLHPIGQLEQYTIAKIKNNTDLQAGGKVNATVKKLQTVFDDYRASYGDEITTTQMNEIRKVMNRDWNPDTVDASRAVGDVAREIVYNATPDLKVKELLRKEGELLSAKKYAETINGTKVVGGRLGNMAMRTAGAIIGSGLEKAPIIGPVIGMIGGEYAARALQQSQFKSAWTELKGLIQSNKTEPSQSANNMPKTAIASKYTPQSVKDVGNPIPTITKGVIDYAKNPKLGMSIEDVSKSNPLLSEARKYKTADEFVKAQTNAYHGTYADFTEFKKTVKAGVNNEPTAQPIFLASDSKTAGNFALAKGGKVMDVAISPDAKIFDYTSVSSGAKYIDEAPMFKEIQEFLEKNGWTEEQAFNRTKRIASGEWGAIEDATFQKYLTSKGYDGFHILEDGQKTTGIINLSKLKTSSQLTDIWKKAHPEQQFSVQQQGMKDSVLKIAKEQGIEKTKDGNLVLYHGTQEGRAPKNGDTWRVGSYFTSSEKVARQFAGQGGNGKIKIMKIEVPPQTIFNSGDGTYFTLNEPIPVKEVQTFSPAVQRIINMSK